MPVRVVKRQGKFRLVEGDDTIAMTPNKKPRDGGGHESAEEAQAQARAINAGIAKRRAQGGS